VLRNPCLRILVLAVVSAAFPVCYLAAQESQDAASVADAAKRAREKKEASTKPANVITNDQIPSVSPADASALNAPQAGTSSGDACSTCANADKTSNAGGTGDEKKNAEIEALKRQLKDKQEALNLLQRELSLDRDNFYGNPDYQRDLAGKQKLDDLQSNLNDKQNELNDLKAKLTELAGADALKEPVKESAPANPPAAPPQ
jgi:predicted RNase H-like nuclease (RuvC/YqgF family)